jgi:hypothetical protein
VGFTLNKQGKLVKDPTYRGRRQIQTIECKYSTDGNIQTIIEHIYDIYEPLRQALQTYGTLKADVKIIPIVISRTGTFHVKTLAEISQLVAFTEEPPDELTFKQLSPTAKRITMALHLHAQEWLSHISKIARKTLTTKTKKGVVVTTPFKSIFLMYKKIIDSRTSSNRVELRINYSIRSDTSHMKNRYYHDSH